MSRILLGVAGGIAAYKACQLVRLFAKAGHEVRVVPTENALQFVGKATWEALSGHPVHASVFEDIPSVPHVHLGTQADLIVVAPATADLLARAAGGRADDLLTNVLLMAACPVVLAPAMHTQMWIHAATRHSVELLRSRGAVVIEPAAGRLAGSDSGPGRMPEPEDIAATAFALLQDPGLAASCGSLDLSGKRVIVSAGGTREAIDPVRFLANSSSGKMGVSLARAAKIRGADVTLIGANLQVEIPAGVEHVAVRSTAELADAAFSLAGMADVVIMAAAVADFTPSATADSKIKKNGSKGLCLELVQTTDVLRELSANRPPGQIIVGFAAETASSEDELVELGTAKLTRKGCQLLVVNDVGGGKTFGSDSNSVWILGAEGVLNRVSSSKDVVAHRILDALKEV
ncbi:MAG: bifunctional phosphopantothenoylcysteine decarboxylase/phosphopantothenate--cysteine ligase CoaBC [Propionibacteriaceae bacterium]|jgi:phosphopantothenoylcysteine decarboxylase/phosphopantothenate--cysteine ligase|nr:bifunctional phosphopantothenoylcysteine decarboxylase/phosphopantothenate--cysteine ligase CoaBC [Propionibacteriaceae bacterium]